MPDVPFSVPVDQIDPSQLSLPAEAGIPLENLDLNQLATEQEYLEKLTPGQLADKEARAMRAGAPVHDLQKFEDASVKRRKEGGWFFEDKRTPEEKASEGEAPKYGWDAVNENAASGGALGAALASPGLTVMRVGQNLFSGVFSFLNETGKMITRNEVMATRSASPAERAENPNKVPVTTFEIPASDQPGANMTAAAKANLVSSANLLREGVTRVANKFFRNENDDEAYREQHRASVAFHAAEQDASEGKSILPDGSQDRKTDSQAVDAVRQFPLLDPSMLIPFGTAAKGVEKAEALAAGTLAERIPAGLAARGLAKTADITAKALRISEKVVDTNPLARGLIAAGLTEAAGGDNSQAVIAGLLGANVKSLGLAKRTVGAAAGAFENTSGKLLGRIPPGPIGRFAASAYRSLSPEARVFAMGQVYNTPFLLGAESEEEFKDMLAAGVVIHSAVSATKGVRNGLSVGSNYFAEGDRAPEIRMNVKDLGIDPQLDTAHRDQMAKLDNSSSNFVQSVRDFMKKTGGEAYVLPVDAFNSYVDGLVGQQLVDRTGSPYVFTKENAELTKQQQGVTLRMPGEDGQIRNVALTPVLDTRPGLSVGHEAGHLLEHALSPEELDHIYRRTHEYYGPAELSKYFLRHEQMIDPSVDVSKLPQTWDDLSADQQRHTLSEIFAEHASAALNGLPIGKFGFETGAKRYAHEVYGMLGRGLEKIGAKRPELSPAITDPKTQVHTGLGIEPSMRLSSLIEAVIAAKDADGLLAKADPKVEPAKPASVPVGSKAETAPVGSNEAPAQEITNIRPVEQKPVAPGFKKGDPVGELKDGEGVLVGEDAKVVKPNADGTYDVEFIDPDTGARQIGTVPASMLESKVTPGVPVPPQSVFPPQPVTPDSPVGASPQPAPLPAPKAVENTTRPQTEATPNVRTTPEKQQALAGPADPAVVAQNLALLKAGETKPRHARGAVETDYYSAKSPVAAPDQMVREAQRRAADAAENAGEANPLRTRYQKIFVPYKVRENKNGSTTVFGMSLDKVAQNLDLLRGWLRLNPEAARTVDASYLNGREIATDLQAYLTNQSNGYAGDGRKLTRPADARDITPENPDFVPQMIAPAKAQVLNLLMGMEQPQTETPGQAFARRFAEANGITVPEVAGVSDTNTLRASLRGQGFDPRILNAVVENLRVDRLTTPLKDRTDLNFPAGDTGIQRAGFMPKAPEFKLGKSKSEYGDEYRPVLVGKEEVGRIEQDYANGGFRALTSARDDLGTAPTAKEALKFFTEDSIKAKPAEPVAAPKQEKSAPAPTGWILPDGKYEGQTDRTGVYQNVGDWHSNHLEQNSAGYAERFGLNYSVKDGDLRRTALNKGFVRLRYDGATGRMGVEANAKFFKGRTRDKIGDILESNIAKIDRLDINLFDDSGNVVDVKNHPQLFRLSGLEKSIALEETLKSRATREVFMPQTPEFKKWFGDWEDPAAFTAKAKAPVSYVVDGEGKPLRVFHSTKNDFTVFETGRTTKNSWAFGSWDEERHAVFFTDDPAFSNEYVVRPDSARPIMDAGARTIPAYLSLKSPADFTRRDARDIAEDVGVNPRWATRQDTWALFDGQEGKEFVAALKKAGYDGAIFTETNEAREPRTTYAVFSPEQIKSASGNRGTFDPSNPDIRFMPKTLKPEEALGEFKEDTLASALKRPGWAILTATQERLGKADDPRNIAANIALEDHLKERGLPYQKVAGSYLGEDQGANFLVTGLSERSALALGKKFKQESVLSNRGYLYQDGSIAPLKHKNTVIGEEAKKQSGYSILPDGTAFSAGIDWDTRIQPDPRETPAYRKIAQHLTEAERENMRSDAATEIVRLFEELPHDEEFETAVRLGHVKKGWYERAAKTLREIFGEDTDAFVGLLAATSPRQTVIENLKMSLRVWKKWNEAGRPLEVDTLKEMFAKDVEMESRLPNTVRALTGKDIAGSEIVESKKLNPGTALSGFKVESFRRNLLGDLQHSTNDAWMAQFAEIQQKIFGTKTGYLAFTAKVRRIATKMDIEAAHVQETIWCFFKTLVEGTTVDRPAAEVLANLTERDILTTPEFHEQLISDPEIKTLLAELGITDDRVASLADNEIAGKRANASDLPLSSTALPAEKDHSRVLKRLAARAQRIKDRELESARATPTPDETDPENPF